MEKLTIEIELTKEELEAFNRFIEDNCIDREKYLQKVFANAVAAKTARRNLAAKRKQG